MNTSKFVRDGDVKITEAQLNRLRSRGLEYAVDTISDVIDSHNIRLPLHRPTLSQAKKSHEDLLALDTSSLLRKGSVFTRYPSERYPLSSRYLAQDYTGMKASDYYHHNARMHCDNINSPSPMRVWFTPKFRKSALRSIFSMKHAHVDMKVLASCITMRKYVASQFRPAIAKYLYETYASEAAVLDMCSGWGDRLQGFLASSASEYVGFDPNIHLHSGYCGQIARWLQPHQEAHVHYLPFEKAVLPSNHFNIAFTSPPYFNIERYSKDEEQSYLRHRDLNSWLKKFLIPTVDKALDSLVVGGHLIVNISDVYSNHQVNNICDPMNDALKKLGAKPSKHFGYRMSKRVGSKSNQDGVFVEPCWHWIKR